MPKYDAFGREIGEDTLSGLGSGAPDRPAPEAEAARIEPGSPLREPEPARSTPPVQPQPQPHAFTAGPAQPQPQSPPPRQPFVSIPMRPPRPRRRRGAGFVLLFVLFLFVAPLLIGGFVAFNAVDGATQSVRDGLESTIKAIPATPEAPAVAPKGVGGRSLVRRDHFAAALAKLSGSELRLTHLRLAPERIDAQLLTRGGALRSVQVKPGGESEQLGPDSGSRLRQREHDPVLAPRPGRPSAPGSPRRAQAPRPGLDPPVPRPVAVRRQDHVGGLLRALALRDRRRPRPLPARLSLERRRPDPPSHPAGGRSSRKDR